MQILRLLAEPYAIGGSSVVSVRRNWRGALISTATTLAWSERGERNASIKSMFKLAQALEISVAQMCSDLR